MTIEELYSIESNSSAIENLLDIQAGNLVPFVGAGISRGCGLLDWYHLVLALAERYLKKEKAEELLNDGPMCAVEKIVTELGGNEMAVNRQVIKIIKGSKVNLTPVVRRLAGCFSPLIVTTNYDTILEEARRELGIQCQSLLPFQETKVADSILDGASRLIKLHGSVDEGASMVLSEKQYQRAYGPSDCLDFEKPVPRALSQLFSSKRILFVGCSLTEDRTLDVLRTVIGQNPNISHYAIVERYRDQDKKLEQNRLLDGLGIIPIYYPEGNYSCVEIIVSYLAAHMKRDESSLGRLATDSLSEKIREDQDAVKNDVLLPWMRESASFRTVFPRIFQYPEYRSLKVRTKVPIERILKAYKKKNIVICGPAGAGKSTLLKYHYLYKNKDLSMCYIQASAWFKKPEKLTAYQRAVLAVLRGDVYPQGHKLILFDGVDEAFQGRETELEILIEHLQRKNNINVWFGWRQEAYFQMETESIRRLIYDQLQLQPWIPSKVRQYVKVYEERMKCIGLGKLVDRLLQGNEALQELVSSPFQLTLLVYLAEEQGKALLSSEENASHVIGTLYGLYNTFFRCWLTKEHTRKTSTLTENDIRSILWKVAEGVYDSKSVKLECEDSAVIEFLYFDTTYPIGSERWAVGFYHWSFCAFFRADDIFHALDGDSMRLIEALSHAQKNDVTDFVRSAIEGINDIELLNKMMKKLMDLYNAILEYEDAPSHGRIVERLSALSAQRRFYLKNEILYLITRFPRTDLDVSAFVETVAERETDPYMRLDIAYGAVLTGPSRVALEYAKELYPGTEAELINRSWTLAYFGDVQAVPYNYRDDGTSDWGKARRARMNRFQSEKPKAIRFRILDIPLIYCFYVSRKWRNLSIEELNILKSIRVDSSLYNADEHAFLEEQKKKLIGAYEAHLGEDTFLPPTMQD